MDETSKLYKDAVQALQLASRRCRTWAFRHDYAPLSARQLAVAMNALEELEYKHRAEE